MRRLSGRSRIAVIALVCAAVIGGGAFTGQAAINNGAKAENSISEQMAAARTSSSTADAGTAPAAVATNTEADAASASSTAINTTQATTWSLDLYPNYVRLVDSPVTIDQDVAAGTIQNSSLDALGRSQRAIGRITYQLVADSAGWRSGFASDVDRRLSGWGHNGECVIALSDGKDYKGYFWNRSHLIADSLGGYDKASGDTQVENLVTGTRMQNVGNNDGNGGMAFFETRTVSYLKEHKDVTVWYSATPIYVDDELICRSVYVQVLSSDGGLDLQGEVYNCANGYTVDYATGTFSAA